MEFTSAPSSFGPSGNMSAPTSSRNQLSTEERKTSSSVSPEEENPCFEEAAVDFYYNYGVHCGFDIRCGCTKKSSDGTVKLKYIYCNKECFNKMQSFDTSNGKQKSSRKCTFSRCGCKTKLVIKLNGASQYIVTEFVEKHNHSMASLDAAQFLKCRQKMKSQHKEFMFGCGKANVGAVRAYKISKQLVGGFSNLGAQKNEYRNFHRDVVAFIGTDDAQLVLNKLAKKKEMCSSFYYEYSVVNGALSRIFWSDSISQRNFHAFGDALTFDASYSLNRYNVFGPLCRYNMIFLPFTGIDNHKRSVTFSAALLSSEDVESYSWILERLTNAWVVPRKSYSLTKTLRCGIRKFWIPAYFRDIPLGGLLRTTSRSESENSFFGSYLNQRMTLVAFFMGYDDALQNQRHSWSMCHHETISKRSCTRTPLLIELYALQTYTRTIFEDVKTELCGSCFDVSIISVSEGENGKVHELSDVRYKRRTLQVCEDSSKDSFVCTCKLFERVGYQCRHVFAALKSAGIDKIPKSIAGNDPEKREYIRCKLKEMRQHLDHVSVGHTLPSKTDIISAFIGASKPIQTTVKSPALVHTKGSGKRLISERDVAIQKTKRPLRMCKVCQTMCNHDSRNCPLNASD
ncbi:hypothetical protein QQ045_023480 [Rhodiola kirilowii]